jgi:EpsI family protein
MNSTVRSRIPWHLVGTVLLLTATLAASKLMAYRKPETLVKPLDSIDRHVGGLTGADNPALTDRVLAVLKPTSYISRTYRKPGFQADLFISYYAQQRAGESMHSPKNCLPGAGWEIWDYGSTEILVNGMSVKVNKFSIANAGQRMLVLYWYQSKNRIIASEYQGKILLARDAFLQKSTAASIVRIIVPDQPGALEAARSLASELIPQVQRCFGDDGKV